MVMIQVEGNTVTFLPDAEILPPFIGASNGIVYLLSNVATPVEISLVSPPPPSIPSPSPPQSPSGRSYF